MIVLEDLKSRNMSKSAKGNSEEHGKMVKQKSGLNRSILDMAWGEFQRQLEYKQLWKGGIVTLIPAKNTSRKCSCCGHSKTENRNKGLFQCLECGFKTDADYNAAINIVAAGHAVEACGGIGATMLPMKQESGSLIN